MPQLSLNNWAIPVADVKAGYKEIGQVTRAYSGVLRRTRAALKREWSITTRPMLHEDAVALVGLARSRGEYWSADSDAFSSKGLAPFQDNGVQAVAGKFGNGFWPTAGSVNLLPLNVATGTDTAGNTSGWAITQNQAYGAAAGGGTLSRSTTKQWQGTGSLYVDLLAEGTFTYGTVGCIVTVTPLTQYTWSAYFMADVTGAVLTCNAVMNNNASFVQGPTSGTSAISQVVWQRLTNTFTTGAGTTAVKICVTESTDSGWNYWTDGWQFEPGSAASPWVAGTSGPLNLGYTITPHVLNGVDAITLSAWARTPTIGGTLFALVSSLGSTVRLTYSALNTLTATVNNDLGGGITVSATWPTPTTYAHIALVLMQNPVGVPSIRIYVNGVLAGSASGVMPNLRRFTSLFLGNNNGVSAWGTAGVLDELSFLPYAASPAQLAAMAGATTAQVAMPNLLAAGDVVSGGPVVVHGSDPHVEVLGGGYMGGSWRNNLASVQLVLSEV